MCHNMNATKEWYRKYVHVELRRYTQCCIVMCDSLYQPATFISWEMFSSAAAFFYTVAEGFARYVI